MKKTLTILVLLLTLVACEPKVNDTKYNKVYVTIYPIEYVVDYLLGDQIEIESIIPLGGDAHNFEPTQKEIANIINSDMFIYLGLGLEEAAAAINNAVRSENVVTLEVGEMLDLDEEHHDEDEHEDEHAEHNHGVHENHHIWIDPEYLIDIASVIKKELLIVYPEFEKQISQRYQELIVEFESIDELYVKELQKVTLDTFIVTHDAFKHYEKYGIKSLAIKDEVHSKDPTQKEINEIIEVAKELGIKHIVYEQNIPCLPAEIIKSQINAEKVILHNLSVMTKTDIEGNKDLIKLMEDNLKVLLEILD